MFAAAVALPLLASAGNIPQYRVSKGDARYAEFTDGTALSAMQFNNGNAVLFGDGRMYNSEHIGPGFPIGFDFRLGGRLFDQFAVDNYGNLYLGRGQVHYGADTFRLGMSTIAYGLYRADVSYKCEGTEGDRVLTVQYKNATLNETGSSKGKYSLQLRLHESDGRIEMAFSEIDTCYSGLGGFATGLRGWDADDTLWLTASGLDSPVTISDKKKPDMLEGDSFIHWDADDYDNGYRPVYVFHPETDTTAPAASPTDLSVSQSGGTLHISCHRAPDAAATVVLISERPYTEADQPVDGETFRGGQNPADGRWYTRLGNATALYYGNDDEISVSYSGAEADRSYYIRAIAANGYPAYGRDTAAEVVYTTPQAGPTRLQELGSSTAGVALYCYAEDAVIVAATTEGIPTYGAGYTGVFGTPGADAAEGDLIDGGGKVIYAGQPGPFMVYTDANRLTYLRAWTVREGVLSSASLDSAVVPGVSFPYGPDIEDYPLNIPMLGWTTTPDEYVPVDRAYGHDRAVCATSIGDTEVTLTSPVFISDRDMTLTFEIAMETEKEAAPGEEGQVMMQGYEPGQFDDTGYLRILSGETTLKEITEYNGTMTRVSTGGNEDGSSTFESVEVNVPATGEAQTVTFAFSTPRKSRLYLRALRIGQTGQPLTVVPVTDEELPAIPTDLSAATIYTITGARIHAATAADLPAGFYIIDGRKHFVNGRR